MLGLLGLSTLTEYFSGFNNIEADDDHNKMSYNCANQSKHIYRRTIHIEVQVEVWIFFSISICAWAMNYLLSCKLQHTWHLLSKLVITRCTHALNESYTAVGLLAVVPCIDRKYNRNLSSLYWQSSKLQRRLLIDLQWYFRKMIFFLL